MATTYAAIPADLEIIVVQGDELNIGFDASINLTGYTFEAIVYAAEASTPGGWSGGDGLVVGDTAAEFSVNVVNLASGQLNLGLTETQTSALSTATSYRWYLRWSDPDDVTRTAISGTFTVRVP
jgi:hypothetical protein